MAKNGPVRLALVGLGNFSTAVGGAAQRSQKAKLVTCFDIVPERRKAGGEKYGIDQERSYEDVLKRKDIDGVLLVTPNAFHCEQAVLAAEYGKHVYVEKPIANTIADGKKMIAACQKAGVTLMVGHVMRRHAGNRKLKELIDQGAIGKPVMVEANLSSNQGFELTPDQFRWRGDDSGCPAGALMTMGIHAVDIFNHLFGPIEKVFAYFKKLYIPAEVEDVHTVIFQFRSGILGYLGSNFASPRINWIRVYGTEANLSRITLRPDRPFAEAMKLTSKSDIYTRLELFEKGKDQAVEIPLPQGDPILEEIDEFAHCIQTGARPETDGEAGLAALAFIRAAIESARTGKEVKLEG